MPIIPALKRLSQEDGHKFRVKLGFIVRPFSKNKKKITKNKEQNNMLKDTLTYLIVKHV